MPTGTTTVDFALTDRESPATVTITGQTDILVGSLVEAWLRCEDSADHNADEHFVEDLEVKAGNIVPGVGFDIQVECRTGSTVGEFNLNWAWI